jgi:hypothetical protein
MLVSALVLQDVPEFETHLTPAARAAYTKYDGKGILLQKCSCGVWDDREHVPAITEETSVPEACAIREAHRASQIIAALTLSTTFQLSLMSQGVDRFRMASTEKFVKTFLGHIGAEEDKLPSAFEVEKERAVKRLAKVYSTAVEKGLIHHGGLCRAKMVQLTSDNLTEKWAIFTMPYVFEPHIENFLHYTWKERLDIINEMVWPRPEGHKGRWPAYFKNEGEV